MTYEELKSRLVRVESALQTISNNSKISKEKRTSLVQKFSVIKESIQKQQVVDKYEYDDGKDRSQLLNYFIKNKLRNLMENISEF